MPSVFETSPTAIPITFVTKSSWDQVAEKLPPVQRQFAAASALPPSRVAISRCPPRTARSRKCCSDSRTQPTRDHATRSGRAPCPASLPPGIYRFANAPPRCAAWRRSPLRSAAIASAATARLSRPAGQAGAAR